LSGIRLPIRYAQFRFRRSAVLNTEHRAVDAGMVGADPFARHAHRDHVPAQRRRNREETIRRLPGRNDLAAAARHIAPQVDVAAPCLDRHRHAMAPTEPHCRRTIRIEELRVDHIEGEILPQRVEHREKGPPQAPWIDSPTD
jgi:hypothetical protein